MDAGPGCSSMAYGFAEEIGPFFINPGGQTLRRNPYAANKGMGSITCQYPYMSVIDIKIFHS